MAEKRVDIVDEDGRVSVSDEVITSIAQIAADKVDGMARSAGGAGGGLKSIFGGEDVAPSIKTDLSDDGVRIEMRISVEYGYPVHEVAQGIQASVQKDIEELAGVTVAGIDVYVRKVLRPDTHASEEEEG